MPKQTTGDFMATLRKASGYTQQEVAEKLNISNRTLSSWETDRTLPDILMLPAIADLYGVSVDELLRGERSNVNDNKSNDISESSLKNVYKNKYGNFNAKYALTLGIALICSAIFVLACALTLWTAAPAWLDWVLLILGIVGLCICIAIFAYQYNTVKLSVGVVLDEDLTADKKAFVTALRHKLENFIRMCALPFALFALITLIAFIVANPQNGQILGFTFYVRYGYIFIICLNFALAAILFISYFILKTITVKSFYSETQKVTAKTNRKLVGKLAMFGAIPLAIIILLNIVLVLVFPNGNKTLYKNSDLDAFRTHMHTLLVSDDEAAPLGEYYLPLPDKLPENGTEYDFGNGFYGVYHNSSFTYPHFDYLEEYWTITYGKEQTPENPEPDVWNEGVPVWNLYIYRFGNNYVANARYYWYDHTYDNFGNKLGNLSIEHHNNKYRLLQNVSDSLSDVEIYSFTIVPICTTVTCAIIYATKRKKQKYGF